MNEFCVVCRQSTISVTDFWWVVIILKVQENIYGTHQSPSNACVSCDSFCFYSCCQFHPEWSFPFLLTLFLLTPHLKDYWGQWSFSTKSFWHLCNGAPTLFLWNSLCIAYHLICWACLSYHRSAKWLLFPELEDQGLVLFVVVYLTSTHLVMPDTLVMFNKLFFSWIKCLFSLSPVHDKK